jgi:protein-S-isoprenylcysteine O-methyltransferase Ste14
MGNQLGAWAARGRVPLGFALGITYLVFAQPTGRLLVLGGAVALLGLALRASAAGCVDKNATLATGGLYAYTRNPLYLGSFIMGLGFSIACGSWILGGIFVAFFLLVYSLVMRREADFLRQKFGEAYARYAAQVPFFFPTLRALPASERVFRWERYRQNREYEAAFGYLAALVFLFLKFKLR